MTGVDDHLTLDELAAGLDEILGAPADAGTLDLLVRRPANGAREVLTAGELDLVEGLVGDNWSTRGSRRTADGRAHPDKQVNLVNARFSALIAPRGLDQRVMVGDQLHVDLDLSVANLPTGTRLQVGAALLEITEPPHVGCRKFVHRFGRDALRFVHLPENEHLRLRGIHARVVVPGTVRPGDRVTKTRTGA